MYLISKVGNLYTWTLLTVLLFRPKIQIRVDRRQKTFDIGCCIPSYSKTICSWRDLPAGSLLSLLSNLNPQKIAIELKPLKGRFQRLASDIYLVKVKRTFSQQRRFLSQDKNLFFSIRRIYVYWTWNMKIVLNELIKCILITSFVVLLALSFLMTLTTMYAM